MLQSDAFSHENSTKLHPLLYLLSLFSLFVAAGAARSMIKAGTVTMNMQMPKALLGLAPALISAPAFAQVDVSTLFYF